MTSGRYKPSEAWLKQHRPEAFTAPKEQPKGRLSLEDLDVKLRTAANLIGIADGDTSGRGRSFVHTKTGDHYIAVAVGLRESDLSIEVVYHPLRMPSVRWHRPLKDFTEAFRPVVEPR